MLNTNVTNFRKNIFSMIENTIKYNEPVQISTKEGNVVMLSEDDYRGMEETLRLLSLPEMKEKILEGKNTALADCVPEEEVQW